MHHHISMLRSLQHLLTCLLHLAHITMDRTCASRWYVQRHTDGYHTRQAKEAAEKLGAEARANLPGPGEVDFLCGGPPCQGYSGMNRFNKGNWPGPACPSVDHYRPFQHVLMSLHSDPGRLQAKTSHSHHLPWVCRLW